MTISFVSQLKACYVGCTHYWMGRIDCYVWKQAKNFDRDTLQIIYIGFSLIWGKNAAWGRQKPQSLNLLQTAEETIVFADWKFNLNSKIDTIRKLWRGLIMCWRQLFYALISFSENDTIWKFENSKIDTKIGETIELLG